MSAFESCSFEEANLFNPAFCSILLTLAVQDYCQKTRQGMPYSLAFLVLPIVLHKPTRDALPSSTSKAITSWLEENTALRIAFADRVMSLHPFIRQAILFACSHELLDFTDDGTLNVRSKPKPRDMQTYKGSATVEVVDCLKRAQFVGRWMAAADAVPAVLALWGVRP